MASNLDESTLAEVQDYLASFELEPETPAEIAKAEAQINRSKELLKEDIFALVVDMPFMGWYLMQMEYEVIENRSALCYIAKTSTHTLYVNGRSDGPHKLAYGDLDQAQRFYLLAHEVSHVLLGHCSELELKSLNHQVANIAMDFVIERLLRTAFNFNIPSGLLLHYSEGDTLYLNTDQPLYIEGSRNMDWYEIYQHLISTGIGKGKRILIGDSGTPYEGDIIDNVEDIVVGIDSKVAEYLKNYAQMHGNMPGGLEAYLQPKSFNIPWENYIRLEVMKCVSDFTFGHTYQSKKLHLGLIRTIINEGALGVIALDTSGSVSDEVVSKGLGAVQEVFSLVRGTLHFIQCDAEIQSHKIFKSPKKISSSDLVVKGRGGTRFAPVFDLVKTKKIKPQILIYITDGESCDMPNENPGYPVLWVTVASDHNLSKSGKVIKVKE